MAEPSRTDAPRRDVKYPMGAPDSSYPEAHADQLNLPELPESASPASNPTLNRSAQAVGRGFGTAVAGVRRLPQQLDKLRSRIHLVPKTERAEETISDIKDSAMEAAADWRDAAEDSIAELKDRAQTYSYEVTERTNRRLEHLRRRAGRRMDVLRRGARAWLLTAQQWENNRPLQFIGGCVAAGFAAGVAFRVWRSGRV